MCLQCPKISVLKFSVASSGLNAILNFSLMHNLHISVTGLKEGMFLSSIFHSTLGCLPPSISFQKWVESVVELVLIFFFMLFLCFEYLCLNFFAIPTYFSSSPLLLVILAWYTTPSWTQAPGSGQSCFFETWQLHLGGGLAIFLTHKFFWPKFFLTH